MLVAVLVRGHRLGVPNLWLDEANSWYVAHLSWTALLQNLHHSPLGPVYFVALKLWMGVAGASEAALRAPSLIASVLLVPLVYAVGRRTVPRNAALAGAALTAVSPLQLYFAQEARMYMLLALLAAVAALAYLRWRDALVAGTPGAARALVLYAVCAALLLGTNLVAAPLLLALGVDAVLVLWRDAPGGPHRRRQVVIWLAANGLIVAAAVGFALLLDSRAATASQHWRGALGVGGALRALVDYPVAAIHGVYVYPDELGRALADLRAAPTVGAARHLASLVILQPLVVAALVAVLARAAPAAWRPRTRVLALAAIVPLVAGAVISVRQQMDLTRYFLYASPFLYLLIGLGLVRLPRGAAVLAAACLVAAAGIGTVRTFRVGGRDSDYRTVARDLMAGRGGAGGVIVQPTEMLEPLSYYLRGRLDLPVRGVAKRALLAPALGRMPAAPVWLVLDYRAAAYDDSPNALAAALGACVQRDQYDDAGGAGVRLVLVTPAARCGHACATCR